MGPARGQCLPHRLLSKSWEKLKSRRFPLSDKGNTRAAGIR